MSKLAFNLSEMHVLYRLTMARYRYTKLFRAPLRLGRREAPFYNVLFSGREIREKQT